MPVNIHSYYQNNETVIQCLIKHYLSTSTNLFNTKGAVVINAAGWSGRYWGGGAPQMY